MIAFLPHSRFDVSWLRLTGTVLPMVHCRLPMASAEADRLDPGPVGFSKASWDVLLCSIGATTTKWRAHRGGSVALPRRSLLPRVPASRSARAPALDSGLMAAGYWNHGPSGHGSGGALSTWRRGPGRGRNPGISR
jgi:hypothetical protein